MTESFPVPPMPGLDAPFRAVGSSGQSGGETDFEKEGPCGLELLVMLALVFGKLLRD